MIKVLSTVWALLLGIVLIMLGNGMHFTLVGLRGGIEGFSSAELAIVTLRLFHGIPFRRASYPLDDSTGRACARFRGAGQLHVGGIDRISAADRTLGLDGLAGCSSAFACRASM